MKIFANGFYSGINGNWSHVDLCRANRMSVVFFIFICQGKLNVLNSTQFDHDKEMFKYYKFESLL